MQEISNMQIKQLNSKKYNILVVKAKTNSLTCWFCLKIVVFCHLFKKKKMFQWGEVTSSSPTLQIYKPFQPFPLPSWLAAHTQGVVYNNI